MSDIDNLLLLDALLAAVPLWILEFRGSSEADRARIAAESAPYLAEHGDALLYKQEGITAKAFNSLARGLAVAAYQPGGVTFSGLHFCIDHAQCKAAEQEAGS